MTPWLVVPVVLAVVVAGGMVAVSRHYRTPQVPHSATPAELGLRFEEIRFPTTGGKQLYGWWIPATRPRPQGPLTVVLVHGWGRNVERVLPFVSQLHAGGCDLLAFDARSHGSSDADGTANMLKFSQDIRAAVDEAGRRRSASGTTAVLGLSVGGAASIHAAAPDRQIAGLVTVGAFAHPGDLMRSELRGHGVPTLLVPAVLRYAELNIGARFDAIAPERHIGHVAGPVLLVHGTDDVIVPAAHGHRLATAGGDHVQLLQLDGRGHSDCDRDPRFWPAVEAWLERLPAEAQLAGGML